MNLGLQDKFLVAVPGIFCNDMSMNPLKCDTTLLRISF